jgi:ACS family hexuronate transporter-like MFS transporter
LLFVVTVSNYVDRQAISIVAPVISAEFRFTNSEIAVIINGFLVAYTVGQFFSGAFMDWVGSRRGFTVAVALWSVASILTSLGRSVASFSAFRFLLGISESGNFPGGIKVISEWFPERERSTAVGLFISGASIGAIITPPIMALLILHAGWRLAFVIVGLPGLVWLLIWRMVYRPLSVHPRLSVAERGYILSGQTELETRRTSHPPILPFLKQRMFWGVFLGRFVEEPASWFYLTWLPLYLSGFRGVSLMQVGFLLTIPFLTLDLGYMGGGWSSSLLIKSGWSLDRARKTLMVTCALLMMAAIPAVFSPSTLGFVLLVSVATLGHGGWAANIMTLPGDMVAHKLAGTLYGMTAFGGGLGSVLFMQITGKLVDMQQSFNTVFVIAGILPILAAFIVLTVTGRIQPMRIPGVTEPVPPVAVLDSK